MKRLALTVDGPTALQPITRSLKVTITANGSTSKETFAVGGLPTTLDLAQPIQLSAWAVEVDGYDTNGQLIGHGASSLASGTAEAAIALAPI